MLEMVKNAFYSFQLRAN